MFEPRTRPVSAPGRSVPLRIVLIAVMAFFALLQPVAAAGDNPSGLPLPRFASTKSAPVNVRVGPGFKYDIAWVYARPAVPVEIIQEFDVWRKIRDVDGSEGWIHQSLLSGQREGLVAPWRTGEKIPLLARADAGAAVRAYLTAKFPVAIDNCDGTWCRVTATDHSEPKRPTTYSGYVREADLWGVYDNEKVE